MVSVIAWMVKLICW